MSLIKNSVWNFLSIIIPSLVALPAFAVIARIVGIEIFGVFTLSFAIVGYASIFDLGLSRALIREIAINSRDSKIVNNYINTATFIVILLSVIAALTIYITSAFIVDFINVSQEMKYDVLSGMQLLSICIPLLLISQVWLAYFEGMENFKELSIFKIVSSSSTVLFPLISILYMPSFTNLILGLLLARIINFIISGIWISNYLSLKLEFKKTYAESLFNFGGWLTIGSIMGPVMVYFDRFILSSIMGTKQIAFYTAPSELVMRLLALPNAVCRTLFPRLSANIRSSNNDIDKISMIMLGVSALFVALPIYIFAEEILTLWMGTSFSGEVKWILRILLIGFIFNSIAQVPFTSLQAKGFSKVTALVISFEVLPYLLMLYVLTKNYGLLGVATAWTIRVIIDTVIFVILNKKYEKHKAVYIHSTQKV